jgi:hypothetical protein
MTDMRVVSVLGLACVLAACAGGGEPGAPGPAEPKALLLGIVWSDVSGTVVRVDPRSLRPVAGKRVALEGHGGPWAFSPDGSLIAFGGERSVRLVDAKRMRVVTDIETAPGIGAAAWPEARRILVVAGFEWERSGMQLEFIDPVARRTIARTHVDGRLADSTETPDGLVVLLAPRRGIGPARLVVFPADGEVRSVPLSRIEAGWRSEPVTEEVSVDYYRTPGVAFDPEQARAYVVGATNVVAEIDIETMTVRYHVLHRERSLERRLLEWLDPAAAAKGASDGSLRRALWLGNGRLAVYGWDDHAAPDGGEQTTTPADVSLVDTADWSIRVLVEGASEADVAGDTLLAYAYAFGAGGGGIGLHGLTLDGERRFHVLDDDPVAGLTVVGRHAYVALETGWCELAVIDVKAGRVVRQLEEYTESCEWPSLLAAAG